MLDKGVQGVVGNFVLKTDPLPVCLCGFYVTTLCMEQLSALLFCGRLEAFLHTYKKTHPSTLILHLLIPFHLSLYWTPTLKHWQICKRNQVPFTAFHETRVVPHFGSCPDLLVECQSYVFLKFTNYPKLYPTLSRGHVYCNRNPNQANAYCLLQVDKSLLHAFEDNPH